MLHRYIVQVAIPVGKIRRSTSSMRVAALHPRLRVGSAWFFGGARSFVFLLTVRCGRRRWDIVILGCTPPFELGTYFCCGLCTCRFDPPVFLNLEIFRGSFVVGNIERNCEHDAKGVICVIAGIVQVSGGYGILEQ